MKWQGAAVSHLIDCYKGIWLDMACFLALTNNKVPSLGAVSALAQHVANEAVHRLIRQPKNVLTSYTIARAEAR